MKGLLRVYLFHLLALWLATQVFSPAFNVGGQLYHWLLATLTISLLNLLVKPIIKLMFFPINALTLGLFSLVINSGIFFIFYKLTPFISIGSWHFPGIVIGQFSLPEMTLSFWVVLTLIAMFITIVTSCLSFLSK